MVEHQVHLWKLTQALDILTQAGIESILFYERFGVRYKAKRVGSTLHIGEPYTAVEWQAIEDKLVYVEYAVLYANMLPGLLKLYVLANGQLPAKLIGVIVV